MDRKRNHSFCSSLVLTCIFGFVIFFAGAGCEPSGDAGSAVDLQWQVTPDPPRVGMAKLNITLSDSTEQLIKGAEVRLEGNMSHPGMEPVLTTAEEVSPGNYSAKMKFTMGGDWFILVNAILADGSEVTKQITIPGVRSEP